MEIIGIILFFAVVFTAIQKKILPGRRIDVIFILNIVFSTLYVGLISFAIYGGIAGIILSFLLSIVFVWFHTNIHEDL